MPWRRVWFKNNKAYARADEEGHLLVVSGRVELCYKPGDPKVYKAAQVNVRVIEGEAALPEAGLETAKPEPSDEKKRDEAPREEVAAAPPPRGSAIVVYTDGACSGNPGEAGAGVILQAGARRLEISRYLGKATNNIAELEAVRVALLAVKDRRRPLLIHTDSAYALGVLTRGWKAKKNPELVGEIRRLLSAFSKVDFIKVEGHAGVPENERADELARQAIGTRQTTENRV